MKMAGKGERMQFPHKNKRSYSSLKRKKKSHMTSDGRILEGNLEITIWSEVHKHALSTSIRPTSNHN